MAVKLAKKVGFCFGVKRAVDMAEEVLKKEGKAYSLGSIIHNKQVVEGLSKKGLKVINTIEGVKSGCVVVSSHGISPEVAGEISRRSLKLADTTCPFVRNAQGIAKDLSASGYKVIIAGDNNHPEVKALVDHAGKKAAVVRDEKGVRALRLKPGEKIGILSQTTQSMDNFLKIVSAAIETKPKELRVINTICKDAEERQGAALKLAGTVDLMLIVGGKNSANTKRLYDVCRSVLRKSYLVESEKDIRKEWLRGMSAVGITSGASTPDWMVRRVIKAVGSKTTNHPPSHSIKNRLDASADARRSIDAINTKLRRRARKEGCKR